MKRLAVDTSTDACSVAASTGADVVVRHEVRPREHTRLLVPMIAEVLATAGLRPVDLDGIVLGAGPGSFIGMRIAASVVQGMAFAADLPLLPVSSLEAIAAEAFATDADCRRVAVAQDAHMHEVYLAAFERDDDGLPVTTLPAGLHAIGPVPGLPQGCAAAGAGFSRYPELLAANTGRIDGVLGILHPRADCLLTLAARRWPDGGGVAAADLELDYLRERVATPPGATGSAHPA